MKNEKLTKIMEDFGTFLEEHKEPLRDFIESAKEEFETCNGLQWSNSQGEGDWHKAMGSAEDCRDGGFDDWRLPTISELQSVFDYDKGEPKIGGFEDDYYWSATTHSGDTRYAWLTFLGYGGTGPTTKTTTAYSYRCVR